MARQVLPVVGAIIGGVVGGAAGAQWGWAIGSVVGNAVDPQVIRGPTIGDIAQQTSQEGTPRPIIFALSPPIAGNIIATTAPRVVRSRHSQGKGGPKVETESVFRTYAIGVCEGIAEFVRVWRNGILVYDVSDVPVISFADNAKFLEHARFFQGTFTQNPSPDLEAVFGVGVTPAHRGSAYMVMADDDLTDLRGSIPQYTFQVRRCEEARYFIEFQAGNIFPVAFPGGSGSHGFTLDEVYASRVDAGILLDGSTDIAGYRISEVACHEQTFPTGDDFQLWIVAPPGEIVPYRLFVTCEVFVNGVYTAGFLVGFDACGNVDGGTPEAPLGCFDIASGTRFYEWGAPSNTHLWVDGDIVRVDFYLGQHDPGQCNYSVRGAITELAARAGLDEQKIDVGLIDQGLLGFAVINTYPCYAALRSLSEVFSFDASNYDGQIHFIPRGADTVATVTENDMLDDDQQIEESKRADAIQIPRVMHLNYYDVTGAMATAKQTSERAGDRRSLGEVSLQSAVVMSADDAATAVVINHKVMIEDQKGELRFCLPDSFLRLVPANPIIVQWQGRSARARIVQVDTDDGYQSYVCLRDRQSAYTTEVEGIPPPPQTPPPSSVIGQTLIEPLDIHILQDADDGVGLSYYVAVSGVLQAWSGAQVELSMDGGVNYTDAASTTIAAVMGDVLIALPDHPQEYPDNVNTFRVTIQTPFAELQSTDLDGLFNRENLALVGDEIIQFMTVDEISEGVWELSYLLRGRKGTATASHAIGERFVLLERGSIALIPAGLLDIGRTFTFRATSFGEVTDTSTVTVDMTYTGRSQIEREVGYLTAHRVGSNAVVDWQGVGRLGGGAAAAQGARFTGYRVTFDDDGSGGSIVVETTAQTLTQDVTALSSPISITVQQVNALTGPGPATEVSLI